MITFDISVGQKCRKITGLVLLYLFRSEKLITMLKSQGFRASRTHFDPTAIRTDANIAQMIQVLSGEHNVKK